MDSERKLMRIASRVFDKETRFRKAFEKTKVGNATLVGMDDDSFAEISGETITVLGKVEVEPSTAVLSNVTIIVEEGEFHGNLKNCVFKGDGEFHGEFGGTKGRFEKGVFAKDSVFRDASFNGGVFDGGTWIDGHARWNAASQEWHGGNEVNSKSRAWHGKGDCPTQWEFYKGESDRKTRIMNEVGGESVVYPDVLFPDDHHEVPFTGKVMLRAFDGKKDSGKGGFLLVKDATFQFSPPKASDGTYYLTWDGGGIANPADCRIPFQGEYNGISANFELGGNRFGTENASFSYDAENGIDWKSGTVRKGDSLSLDGRYDLFTGSIRLAGDKAVMTEGSAVVEGGAITDINAPDCGEAIASRVTTADGAVGANRFRSTGASIEYDSMKRLEWKQGNLHGGKVEDCKWRDGEFKDGTWVSGIWMADDSKWKGGRGADGKEHPEGESPRKWGFDILLDSETDVNSSSFKENYTARYNVMREFLFTDSKSPIDLSQISRFGKLEEVLFERKRGNQIDAIYSSGIRAIYNYDIGDIKQRVQKEIFDANDPNEARRKRQLLQSLDAPSKKMRLMLVSVEFIDAATLRTLYEEEDVFTGFGKDGKPLAAKNAQGWEPSRELVANVIAISKSRLYESGTIKNDPNWYARNIKDMKENFFKNRDKALAMDDEQLDKEYMMLRIFIDAWKYDLFMKRNAVGNLKGLLGSKTYNQNKDREKYRKMFDKAIGAFYGYKPVFG